MGTNYYFAEKEPCECCGRPFPKLHIGKSSCGWYFKLRVYSEMNLYGWEDWKKLLKDHGKIFDEYDQEITFEMFEIIVTQRKINEIPTKEFAIKNKAKIGIHNLLKPKRDRNHIGDEGGTWSLVAGDFS